MMSETAAVSALWHNEYKSEANWVDMIGRYALPGVWLVWHAVVWVAGGRLLSGAGEWEPADGMQHAYSNLEYCQRKWVLPEPISARNVNKNARGAGAGAGGGSKPASINAAPAPTSSPMGLSLPSTKTTTRDGRPVPGAKPSIALSNLPVHKPQPHNHPQRTKAAGESPQDSRGPVPSPAALKKRTNSGSLAPAKPTTPGGQLTVSVVAPTPKQAPPPM
jgi:hypothetical protein